MASGSSAEGTPATAASPAREHRSEGVTASPRPTVSGLRAVFHAAVLAVFVTTVLSLTKPADPEARGSDSATDADSAGEALP